MAVTGPMAVMSVMAVMDVLAVMGRGLLLELLMLQG
jgi:hypothetical protein